MGSWHAVRTPTYHFSHPWPGPPPGHHQVGYARPTPWGPDSAGYRPDCAAYRRQPFARSGTDQSISGPSTCSEEETSGRLGAAQDAVAGGSTPIFNLDLRGLRASSKTISPGRPAKVSSYEPTTGRTGSTETGGDSTDDDSWTPPNTNTHGPYPNEEMGKRPELNSRIRKRPLPPTMKVKSHCFLSKEREAERQQQGAGGGEPTSTGITRRKSPPVRIASPIEHDVMLEEIAVRPADVECLCVRCAMQPQHGGLPSLSLVGTWARARHSAAAQRQQQVQKQQHQQQLEEQQMQQFQKFQQAHQQLRSMAKQTGGGVPLNLRKTGPPRS